MEPPTAELVRAACNAFDQKNLIAEQALKELFTQYPSNNNLPHVLLKVVALNRLYSTQIFAVMDTASHIHASEIDADLAAGSLEIVKKIAVITNSTSGKRRNNYSFATKYCNWHNPASYPIWDARVDSYLWSLRKQKLSANDVVGVQLKLTAISGHFGSRNGFPAFNRPDLRDYARFVEVITAFRDYYHLGSFTFKEIDKFLWSYDRNLAASPATRT